MDGYLIELQLKPVMLKKDIKNIFALFLFLLLQSCDSEIKEKEKSSSNNYVETNFAKYKQIYFDANDSIVYYANSKLSSFLTEYSNKWQVDSMMCINSTSDKLVGVIISSVGILNHDVTDDATKFLGKKINGNWYFFKGGGSLAIPRSLYGKTGSDTLSFHELSQIARKEFLESSLIQNEKGKYIVNDKWVDEHFYNAGFDNFTHHKVYGLVSPGEEYQMPRDKEKTDSVHWHLIIDKWKHKIDTNEYKPLRKTKKEVLP